MAWVCNQALLLARRISQAAAGGRRYFSAVRRFLPGTLCGVELVWNLW